MIARRMGPALPSLRRRRPGRALALAALSLAACLPRGTLERPVVRSLRIEGAHGVPADEVVAVLATQPTSRYVWPFQPEPQYFDEDLFAADRRRVEAFYRSRGYYGARVSAEPTRTRDGLVDLAFRVEEGKPVRVAEVRIEGVEGEPEALSRLGKMPLAAGSVFTDGAFDAGRAAIERALQDAGWARAEVEQRAEVDPAALSARVVYTVRPGRRYLFGNVFVSGTGQVPRDRVRRAATEVMTPGSTWDQSLLPGVQSRVQDLGVFGGIRVFPGEPDPATGALPLVVAVREAPFRTVRLGPSLTFQASRTDASLTAGWTHRNWLGGLRRLKLDARVGWTWLKAPWDIQKQGFSGLASADFTQPEVLGRSVDLNLRAELERRIEEGFQYWAERLRLGLPVRIIGRTLTLVPAVLLEYYQTRGDTTAAQVGSASQALLSCPGDATRLTQTCLLSALEQRLDLDLRDDALNPRRGIYLTLSLQEGFQAFGQGFRYLRLLPEARAFLPIGATVLAARGRVGLLRSYGGDALPIIARLESGGPGQMRGYDARRLSPLVALATGGFAPVGGTALLDGSLEARFPLAGSLGGVVFVDGGNVELRTADIWKLDRLQWAAGFGLRYRTLFGPVRIDLAARLPREFRGDWPMPKVPVVALRNGAVVPTGEQKSEPVVRVHLSIGEAF
jgi:translocation and assembly module TamA